MILIVKTNEMYISSIRISLYLWKDGFSISQEEMRHVFDYNL